MSAAHCVCEKNGDIRDLSFKIIGETIDLNNYYFRKKVIKIYTLKNFNVPDYGTAKNDIAILRVKLDFL